jgi:heme/copper-type cytochrome/quinol oxidase subunit 2
MEGLDLQQLELLIYIFIGLVTLTLLGLFIYVVISVRRRGAQVAAPLYDSDPVPESR